MYAARWSPSLRQGDIIDEMALPLLTKTFDVHIVSASLFGTSKPIEHVRVPAELRFAAVISHDCEFNENKRRRFFVARLESLPRNMKPEQRDKLRASNNVRAELEATQQVANGDQFVVDAIPGYFDDERVIQFQTIVAIPMDMASELQTHKVAELEHEHRLLLRRKLGWFLARGPNDEDIPDEEKIDPPPRVDAGTSV